LPGPLRRRAAEARPLAAARRAHGRGVRRVARHERRRCRGLEARRGDLTSGGPGVPDSLLPRRRVLRTGVALFATATTFAVLRGAGGESLPPTPRQTAGPFYPQKFP